MLLAIMLASVQHISASKVFLVVKCKMMLLIGFIISMQRVTKKTFMHYDNVAGIGELLRCHLID